MKKRIIATITAILMCMTALVLSACQINIADNSGETSETSEPINGKDIFNAGIENIVVASDNYQIPDYKAMNLAFDGKLKAAETELDVDGSYSVNSENGNYKADVTLNYGDESMPLELTGNEEAYYVWLRDIYEAPIPYESDTNTEDEYFESPMETAEISAKVSAVYYEIAALWNTDKLDSQFTVEEADGKITAELIKLTDEKIQELCGEIEAFDGCDIEISGKAVKTGETIVIESCNLNLSYEYNEKTVSAICSAVGTENSLTATINITYDVEELIDATVLFEIENGLKSVEATASFSQVTEDIGDGYDYSSKTDVTVYANYNETEKDVGGKGEIGIDMVIDYYGISYDGAEKTEMGIVIPFECKNDETGFTFTAKKIEFNQGGATVSLDMGMEICATLIENGYEIEIALVSNLAEFEGSIDINITVTETEAFEIEVPDELMAADYDITTDIAVIYPEIYSFFLGSSAGEIDGNKYVETTNESYTFCDDGTGAVFSDFRLKEYSDGKATVIFNDGTEKVLEYNIIQDSSDEIQTDNNGSAEDGYVDSFTIEIDGEPYNCAMYAMYECEGAYSYHFTCFEEFESEYLTFAHSISYDSFENSGGIITPFNYTAEGDEYTITYLNGDTETKTLIYDEEYMSYYFEGDLPYGERYIYVEEESYSYTFSVADGRAYYSAYFDIDSYGSGNAVIIGPDGEEVEVSYTEAVYDESYDIYILEIEGSPFAAWYEDDENSAYLSGEFQCDCINGVIHTISMDIDLANGIVWIYADGEFTADGDVYTITFPNGIALEKKLIYDEESELYHFGE